LNHEDRKAQRFTRNFLPHLREVGVAEWANSGQEQVNEEELLEGIVSHVY
jgi:hypothetical protein